MADYGSVGYDKNLNRLDSLPANQGSFTNALTSNISQEPTPYLHRTSVSKGLVQTTLGGLVDFRDPTGGTSLLTYSGDMQSIIIKGAIEIDNTLDLFPIANGTGPSLNLHAQSATGTGIAVLSVYDGDGGNRVSIVVGTGGGGHFTVTKVIQVSAAPQASIHIKVIL